MEESTIRNLKEESVVRNADAEPVRDVFVELGRVTTLTRRASGNVGDGSSDSNNNMWTNS